MSSPLFDILSTVKNCVEREIRKKYRFVEGETTITTDPSGWFKLRHGDEVLVEWKMPTITVGPHDGATLTRLEWVFKTPKGE